MGDVNATNDLDTLLQWKGRSRSSTEIISASWCNRLQQTLDRPGTLVDGNALPPLWHFISHLHSVPTSEIGPDGHPKRGDFLPPVALPRRMWAGSQISFDGPLEIGDEVTKTSTVCSIEMKEGRTGPLCFVAVHHELAVGGDVRITEAQDLVYREQPDPDALTPEPKLAPVEAEFQRVIQPTEVMLFRYSALMFNGHRIHYDRDYARDVEGYAALVVHGPLTATLLAQLAVDETGRSLASFSFRGVAPLLDTEPFTIAGTRSGDRVELWAKNASGGLAMTAQAELRPA
ncbi:MAG: acyl-CoA dehydrogenase [Acidimicrobiales bacterium]|nr:acyl-CoA dehydrogenase [Acidimicrobiales bacterium]